MGDSEARLGMKVSSRRAAVVLNVQLNESHLQEDDRQEANQRGRAQALTRVLNVACGRD